MPRELSTATDANPAALLREEYDSLMACSSRDALAEEASAIIKGSAISEKNLAKWYRTIARIPNLTAMQHYVTNFLLAADGNRVLRERQGAHNTTRREFSKNS